MNGMDYFDEFQMNALQAYQCLSKSDKRGFHTKLQQAALVRKKARYSLPRSEFREVKPGMEKVIDVLRKCTSLGLINLEKRLREFGVKESVKTRLAARQTSLVVARSALGPVSRSALGPVSRSALGPSFPLGARPRELRPLSP